MNRKSFKIAAQAYIVVSIILSIFLFVPKYFSKETSTTNIPNKNHNFDADTIVIGGGLSGLTAAISLVDRGATVILVEKNPFIGGNSAYASSGINAVDP